MRRALITLLALAPIGLAGCDLLGIESATVVSARREAEAKAIGAGCRHSARSVEQCYNQNRRADKAAIFAGWKEMNEYMVENKIEAVPPPAEPAEATSTEVAAADDTEVAPKKASGAKKSN